MNICAWVISRVSRCVRAFVEPSSVLGGDKGKPPSIGSASYPPLLDAPGSYVLEK
jgi:hypothetical protein